MIAMKPCAGCARRRRAPSAAAPGARRARSTAAPSARWRRRAASPVAGACWRSWPRWHVDRWRQSAWRVLRDGTPPRGETVGLSRLMMRAPRGSCRRSPSRRARSHGRRVGWRDGCPAPTPAATVRVRMGVSHAPMRRLSSSPCCDQPTMRATAGRRSSSPTARATSGATTGERMGAKLRARMVGPRLSAGPSGQRARRMHARRRLGAARS